MKKLALVFTAVFLVGATVSAKTTNALEDNSTTNLVNRGYGNSFIFTEGGIEFSVFPDGQFDFYAPDYGPDVNVSINTPNASFSFNTGYDYSPYVQYDDFGAIIQIENTPIYYDFYGRVTQVGNVNINYNNYGRLARVGGLYVHYNNFNVYTHYSGYINVYNRAYVYRPWHVYYAIPAPSFCIVYSRPYRQFYTPIRHHYYSPYTNNYRHAVHYDYGRVTSNNSGRHGTTTTNSRISDRYRQDATARRGDASLSQNTLRSTPDNRNDNVGRTSDARINQPVRNSNNERVSRTSFRLRENNIQTNVQTNRNSLSENSTRLIQNARGNNIQENVNSNRNIGSLNSTREAMGERRNSIERTTRATPQRIENTSRSAQTTQRLMTNRTTSAIGRTTQSVNNLPNRNPNNSNTRISNTKQEQRSTPQRMSSERTSKQPSSRTNSKRGN